MSIIGNEKMLEIARDLVYEMVKADLPVTYSTVLREVRDGWSFDKGTPEDYMLDLWPAIDEVLESYTRIFKDSITLSDRLYYLDPEEYYSNPYEYVMSAKDMEYGESYDIVRHKYTGEMRYTNI